MFFGLFSAGCLWWTVASVTAGSTGVGGEERVNSCSMNGEQGGGGRG